MRVTNKMLSTNFLKDMQNNLSNMKTLQGQLTSGKEIKKPSDNPFKVARAMQLHTDINTNIQYKENINDASSWLETTDAALNQVGNVLQRVRELLVSSGNASYGKDELGAIKNEMNQKIGELAQTLNTNFDGKYLFGGTRGTAKPVMDLIDDLGNFSLTYSDRSGTVAASSEEIEMIKSDISVELSQGVSIIYNVNAGDVLQFENDLGDNLDLMGILSNITSHLDGKAPNGDAEPKSIEMLTGQDLVQISEAITNVLKLRSSVGAKTDRLDSALSKNSDEKFNMTDLLSQTEDIDITEKTMEYANMQTVYIASLQTSAKVLQPSLMDFLR